MKNLPNLGRKLWALVVHPERLKAEFPLTGKELAKEFLKAQLWLRLFLIMPMVFLYAFLLLLLLVALGLLPLQSLVQHHIAKNLYLLVIAPILRGMMVAFRPENRQTLTVAFIWLTVLSSACVQLIWVKRLLAKNGRTLRDVMPLNLKSLSRGTWWQTAWAFFWRVIVGSIGWIAIEHLLTKKLPPLQQGPIDATRYFAGANRLLFFVVAALAGPIVEEVFFRGCWYQAIRVAFARGRIARFLGNGLAEIAAIIVSGLAFWIQHLQFNITAAVLLTVMGCYFAYLYRRSGTLWMPIALHAVNNGLAVMLLHH